MVRFVTCANSSSSTFARLLRPGGVRAVAAESLLLKHQLLISNRARQRAPNLKPTDRFVLGLTTLFVSPRRIPKLGVLIKPATLFKFHKALVDRKYRLLFSSSYRRRKPGPKGPSVELIATIIELKRRNPRFGCVRIAQQISHAFGADIDKDVVRRVLAKHYRPGDSGTDGRSWLTFIGHVKDSLWSVDLFRCESILLHSHWVLLVMDVYTRRLVGFDVERANIDGVSVCRMFNRAIAGVTPPKRVRTDHDPLVPTTRKSRSVIVPWKGTCYSASKAHRHMQGDQSPCVKLSETYPRQTVDRTVRGG
jgi:putative transposase